MTSTSCPPSITVVVCNGRAVWPADTILSLVSSGLHPNDCIVVVGSNRPPKHRSPQTKHIHIVDHRANVKRNAGIDAAETGYLFFLDDDVQVEALWRTKLANHLKSPVTISASTLCVQDLGSSMVLNENGMLVCTSIAKATRFDEEIGPGTCFGSSEALDFAIRSGHYKGITQTGVVVSHPALDNHTINSKYVTYSLGNGYVLGKHRQWTEAGKAIAKEVLAIIVGKQPASRLMRLSRIFAMLSGFIIAVAGM